MIGLLEVAVDIATLLFSSSVKHIVQGSVDQESLQRQNFHFKTH